MTDDAIEFEWSDDEVRDLLDAYLNITATDDDPAEDPKNFDALGHPRCLHDPECDDITDKGDHSDRCDAFYWANYNGKGIAWSKADEVIGASTSGTTSFGSSFSWSKCKHNQAEFTLSDGTVILASSHQNHTTENEPDLGVYLDGIWTPGCMAFHVGWRDFGLPYLSDDAFRNVVEYALAAAREGKRVEVGCIGGHGRTGTMLAILECFALVSKGERADAAAAVKKVRAQHCNRAIETGEQEWYVAKWAAILNGEPEPAKPVKPVAKKATATTSSTTPAKKKPAAKVKPKKAFGKKSK